MGRSQVANTDRPETVVPAWVADATKDLPPFLTKDEIVAFLRVSLRSVDRLLDSGRLTRIKPVNGAPRGRCLIARASIVRLLVESEVA